MLPVHAHAIPTAHSLQSASETIISDDDTPIASIPFEDAAARAVRRLQRESKRKAKDESGLHAQD